MIIRPEAEADLADAQAWYESQHTGLGEEFLQCVGEAPEEISLMPELHRIIHHGVRRAHIRRFPFTVYYRIEADRVVVIGVLQVGAIHGSGNLVPNLARQRTSARHGVFSVIIAHSAVRVR